MLFLFLFALIIFGPRKLPEIGRQIGRALNEFKRASNEFKAQIQTEIDQIDLENQRQQMLPPAVPPHGSIAAFPPPASQSPNAPNGTTSLKTSPDA